MPTKNNTHSKAHSLPFFHQELAQKSEEVALTTDCQGNTEYQCRCCFLPHIWDPTTASAPAKITL